MVQIFPFHGLRYNLNKVESLTHVTAPPYDVIERDLQDQLHKKHPANIVRVILGEKTNTDTETENVYTRAAQLLNQWQNDDILIPDEQPTMYAYSQKWTDGQQQTHTRKGLIALLKVEDYASRQVLPHERTIAKYIADRFELAKTTGWNLSQIFMIYSDPQRLVETQVFQGTEASDDWNEAVDEDGIIHRLKAFQDPTLIHQIQELFKNESLLIADGHHRYQTALSLKAEARERYKERFGQDAPENSLMTDYMMVFLANMDDPGLMVYPTHRVLKSWPEGWNQERFEKELLTCFKVVDTSQFQTDITTLIYEGPGRSPQWTLKLTDPERLKSLAPLLHDLDAAILDQVIFQGFFNDTAQNLKETHRLWFDRSDNSVNQLMQNNDAVAAFYLHAPSVHQVKAICESGELMPQKSTYFYPKILTGNVFHSYIGFKNMDGHSLSNIVDGVQTIPADLFKKQNTPV